VTGLERSGIGGLVHVEIAHVLGLVVLCRLLWVVVLGLSPIALEVARRCAAMALAPTALEVGLSRLVVITGVIICSIGCFGWSSSGREGKGWPTASGTSSTTANSHTLAATVSATSATARRTIVGTAAWASITIRASTGLGQRKLETRSLSLLFCQFRSFFGIGESQRVSTSVSRATSSTSAATARVYVFSALCTLLLCTKVFKARCTRRRRRRRTHANIRKGGLIAAVRRGLCRGVHGYGEVWLLAHLLGKLEVVGCNIWDLSLHLKIAKVLLWLDHAHVDILLMRCSNLLLLLLEHFDLLRNCELFHH